jgi:hypothetical protein
VAVILIVPVMAMIVIAVNVSMAMIMILMVPMVIMVPVIMMRVIMMGVIMPVGAAVVGLKRRHHHRGRKAALPQQLRELGMRQHAQAVGEDLDGNVAVAQGQQETPGLGKVLLPHLEHGFDIGHDFDEMAVVEYQAIVGAQQRRDREIEFDAGPLAAEHEALLLHTVLEFEQQRVDDFAGTVVAGAENFLGAWHGAIRIQWRVGRSLSPAPGSSGKTDDGRSGPAPASTLPTSTLPAGSSARASRRAYSR